MLLDLRCSSSSTHCRLKIPKDEKAPSTSQVPRPSWAQSALSTLGRGHSPTLTMIKCWLTEHLSQKTLAIQPWVWASWVWPQELWHLARPHVTKECSTLPAEEAIKSRFRNESQKMKRSQVEPQGPVCALSCIIMQTLSPRYCRRTEINSPSLPLHYLS